MAATSVIDDRAFERMYRKYVRDVYRFALALVRNPSDAEDVTQTTFMNAYRALQAGEEPRRPHSWLLTIAHNTARSRVRRAMRRPREVPLEDVVSQLAVPEHERTNVRELLRALGRLPFNQRAAITMRELEGRSYPEIAETLGVTVPAVEALLTRARRSLRVHAAAIRGLTVVGLPRSLRRLLEKGDATTGGALGAGLIAKAAALVIAGGVVVGGIGSSSGGASRPAAPAALPALVPHDALVLGAPSLARTTRSVTSVASAGRNGAAAPAVHRIGLLPWPDADARVVPSHRSAQEASAPPGGTAADAPPAPVRAAVRAAAQPVRPTVDTVKQGVSTVAAAVPQAPVPSVGVPTVPLPPVQPPAVTVRPLPPPPAVSVPTPPAPPPVVTVPTLPPPPTVTVPTLPPPPTVPVPSPPLP